MILANHGIISSSGGTLSYDADALAFITAASITDNTQKIAVNELVTDLKGYSIWSKFSAIYPMVGGTSFTHKFNLKDPRDLTEAFRLTFANTWYNTSTGARGDGGAAYAETYFNPSLHGSLNSHHISFYSRTNENFNKSEMGLFYHPNYNLLQLYIASGNSIAAINQSVSNTYPIFADTNSIGYYIGNRNGVNSSNIWKNGVIRSSATGSSGILLNGNMLLSAHRNLYDGQLGNFSGKECAFATIGQGLSDTEASNLYLAVQKFNTTLGRQV